MASLHDQLVKHIDEAIAMEENVKRMLDGMIQTTDDPGVVDLLEQHKVETEQHSQRLRGRLQAHGASPSLVREATGILGALAKLPLDMVRGRRPAATHATATRPSTWRSPRTSYWSGSRPEPATTRPPRSPDRTAPRRRRWRSSSTSTGITSPSSHSAKKARWSNQRPSYIGRTWDRQCARRKLGATRVFASRSPLSFRSRIASATQLRARPDSRPRVSASGRQR